MAHPPTLLNNDIFHTSHKYTIDTIPLMYKLVCKRIALPLVNKDPLISPVRCTSMLMEHTGAYTLYMEIHQSGNFHGPFVEGRAKEMETGVCLVTLSS